MFECRVYFLRTIYLVTATRRPLLTHCKKNKMRIREPIRASSFLLVLRGSILTALFNTVRIEKSVTSSSSSMIIVKLILLLACVCIYVQGLPCIGNAFSALVLIDAQAHSRSCARPSRSTRLFYEANKRQEDKSESSDSRSRKRGNDSSKKTHSSWKARNGSISRTKFATGSELKRLREELATYRENRQWAEALEDHDRVEELATAIRNGEDLDPDIVYTRTLVQIANLQGRSDLSSDDKHAQLHDLRHEADHARSFLPQFELEGLWIGKYVFLGLCLVAFVSILTVVCLCP
jgi:hypothetical protein